MPRVPQHLETAGITVQRTNRQPSAHSTQLHAGCAKHAAEQQPPPHAAPLPVLGVSPTSAGITLSLIISKVFPSSFLLIFPQCR